MTIIDKILDYIEDKNIGRMRGRTRRQAPYSIDFWNMVKRVKNNMHSRGVHGGRGRFLKSLERQILEKFEAVAVKNFKFGKNFFKKSAMHIIS